MPAANEVPTPQSLGLIRDPLGFFRVAEPPPSGDFYRQQFYTQAKPAYLTRASEEWPYWRRVYRWRLERLAPPVGKLLDVGAGGGFFLRAARELGWQVCGIEPSEAACAFAREHFNLNLLQGEAEFVEPREAPFDAIHCAFVLEHIADPIALLHRLFAWLKPSGRIWLEVPNEWNPLQKLLFSQVGEAWWVVPRHHLNYFDGASLSNALTHSGFQILECYASFPMEAMALAGLNYVSKPELGEQAHAWRMVFESRLLDGEPQLLGKLYQAFYACGIGRTISLLGGKP